MKVFIDGMPRLGAGFECSKCLPVEIDGVPRLFESRLSGMAPAMR